MIDDPNDEFYKFVERTEPRLRRALVAGYGSDRGREATAEALAYAWEHWGEVRDFENLTGYLYRVGQSRTRTTKERVYFERPESSERWYEPELVPALTKLTESQRTAVVLIYGFGWTMREIAECTGVKISSVQTHLDRGLKKLRAELKVMNNA